MSLWIDVLRLAEGVYLRGNLVEKKTYKREVAAVFAIVLIYLILTGKTEMVNATIWPIMALVGGAFGLSGIKQLR